MNLPALAIQGPRGSSRQGERGFSLTDVMVASTIFLFVIGGVLTAHYSGMSMYKLMQEKLGANGATRKAFNILNTEIRSAASFRIGTGSATAFTELGVNTAQQANSIQLYPTTDTNNFIRYYRDTADKALKRLTSSAPTPTIVAEAISNTYIFTCENFAGTILTNRTGSCVVGIKLQYYQLPGSNIPIGTGKYYKTYQLETKVNVRADN